ncbi:MAG TPA: regulatory signaling modulator protein AmpE [Gammaproteobacteria bacterium]|nr:regulatory signaling modulator protein AmpE [Gammaproteobacteria bacterium]
MTLLSILAALLVERFLGHLQELRRFDGFLGFAEWVRERFHGELWEGPLGVLVVLAVPVAVTGLLQHWLSQWLFGLPGLAFAIVVLLYCLGPRDLAADAESYQDAADSADDNLARRAADRLLDGPQPADADERHGAVLDGVLQGANTRLFAVLFWFVVLGPMGAVLYRCTVELQAHSGQEGFAEAVRSFHALLAWLPAWLVAAGFAVSGDFEGAVTRWREGRHSRARRFAQPPAGIVVDAGRGALGLDPEGGVPLETVGVAMGLVWRTLAVWVFVIALFTLAGWAA